MTVNVTTPLGLEGPLAAEIVELPDPCASVTVFPLTGLSLTSLRVTVIVEVVEPSATTEVGLALTVEWPALAVPPVMVSCWLAVLALSAAVAQIVGVPVFVSL